MPSDAVVRALHGARWALLLRGLVALSLGVFIIARPLESVAALALVIAIWALVSGLMQMVHAFEVRATAPHWWLLMLGGVISTAFGIGALYLYPGLSLTLAVLWVAYWLLLTGFVGVYAGMVERRAGLPWVATLVFGVVSALAGVYAIAAPPVTLVAIMGLIAGFAILSGIVLLVAAYQLTTAHARLAGTPAATHS
jgi:uncharacterized membrane protein HdeD (DUF308 family)